MSLWIFCYNLYKLRFDTFTPRHILELFDKLVSPILNYGAEVWRFFQASQIERVLFQFCKRLLGVKKCTQNNLIFWQVGKNIITKAMLFYYVKYWLKIVNSDANKMIKYIYLTRFYRIWNATLGKLTGRY